MARLGIECLPEIPSIESPIEAARRGSRRPDMTTRAPRRPRVYRSRVQRPADHRAVNLPSHGEGFSITKARSPDL